MKEEEVVKKGEKEVVEDLEEMKRSSRCWYREGRGGGDGS